MEGGRSRRSDGPKKGTAPSAGNLDDLEKMEASDEAKESKPSDLDALGQDKRREVIGHSYGPSKKSQLLFFAAIAGVFVLIIGGYFAAVAVFDQPKDSYADQAPWSQPDAAQNTPVSPRSPCGEPGNPHPAPKDSPCATPASSGPADSGEPDLNDQ